MVDKKVLAVLNAKQDQAKFTYEQVIANYLCDQHGKMTLSNLFSAMIYASTLQQIAVNAPALPKNLGWVITNHTAKISRLPRKGELITFGTQATSWNKFFCYRKFWATAADGRTLVEVNSVFVLLDLAKRRMARVQAELVERYQAPFSKKVQKTAKITPIVAGEKNAQTLMPQYSDIDDNRHVNNTNYFRWMINLYDDAFLAENEPQSIIINYEHEILPKVPVQSSMVKNAADAYHKIAMADAVGCEAMIAWRTVK